MYVKADIIVDISTVMSAYFFERRAIGQKVCVKSL